MLDKIGYLFTQEYKNNVEYYDFLEKQSDKIKLKNRSESIDSKIERLINKGIKPSFRIKIGRYQ